MNNIFKVYPDPVNLRGVADGGRVVRVFDTNGFGDLVPILFTTIKGGFQLDNRPAGQVYVEVSDPDDDFAVVDGEWNMKDFATGFNADHTRILKALGHDARLVIGYTLTCSAKDLVELHLRRHVTNGELRALAEELEANPPTKKEEK